MVEQLGPLVRISQADLPSYMSIAWLVNTYVYSTSFPFSSFAYFSVVCADAAAVDTARCVPNKRVAGDEVFIIEREQRQSCSATTSLRSAHSNA